MKKNDKTKEKEEDIRKRSEKRVEMLESIKGMSMKDFPVPPFTKWLNGRIISAKRGEVLLEIDVRKEMSNPTGILHGGMQSAILDDVIGITTITLGYEGFLISIDMHVDFLGKVKIGETIRARGYIQREGSNIVHAEGELIDKDGETIATATSNLLKTSYKADYPKVI
ncbi:MAG: hotdog fold thioesterase [Candidatus Lokiarchaeota archaeon]|nr:hotdog fold thioesterase [Candidatus Lokiarchaeota archaeon]